MKTKEHVWKVGQKVFTARDGWGVVIEINSDDFPIVVKFDDDDRDDESYTCDGRQYLADKYPTLSFTNYITDRFSQDPKDATYAQIEPDFDWGCLPKWADEWIARDKNGIWYAYGYKPFTGVDVFKISYKGDYVEINPDYFPKNSDKIDWEKSLFKNPNK